MCKMYVIHGYDGFIFDDEGVPVLRDADVEDELALELPRDREHSHKYWLPFTRVFLSQHGGPVWVLKSNLTEIDL